MMKDVILARLIERSDRTTYEFLFMGACGVLHNAHVGAVPFCAAIHVSSDGHNGPVKDHNL